MCGTDADSSDNVSMGCFSCITPGFKALSRAAAKATAARLRALGRLTVHPHWQERAEMCERCPMRVIASGRTYCGSPFLQKIDRDPATDGCGCPTIAKAKDPSEHCPLTPRYTPATRHASACDCRWCQIRCQIRCQ